MTHTNLTLSHARRLYLLKMPLLRFLIGEDSALSFRNLLTYCNGAADKLLIIPFRGVNLISTVLTHRFPIFRGACRRIEKQLVPKITLNIDGIKYSGIDWDALHSVLPVHELWIWTYFKPRIGDVFVDVGACIGGYALQVAKKVGAPGLVIALEPDYENFKSLVANARLNGLKILPLNIAAYDRDCSLRLFAGEASTFHSVKMGEPLGSQQICAKTLDGLLAEKEIRQVNWVKIDVEGAEYEVLRGLEKTLHAYHPNLIVEVWNVNSEKVTALLSRAGYTLYSPPNSEMSMLTYVLASVEQLHGDGFEPKLS
jgi:FkbM family methyltransferase